MFFHNHVFQIRKIISVYKISVIITSLKDIFVMNNHPKDDRDA